MEKFNGEKLREIREAMGLTQDAFATLIGAGLKRQNVNGWEQGASPGVKNLLRISKALGKPVEYFFFD